jgi:eukaryotic-like serine/threonine-protein kinase
MDPKRWQQVKELYQDALEREASQRAAFLDGASGGDANLRREVESLLAFGERGKDFLETPALEVMARSLAEEKDASHSSTLDGPSLIGRTVSHFHILEKVGAGGMGEVYRARDSKLNRDVALKVLPEILARDPERMARFKREAQVLASLNHPNIATIYGFEESDGLRALAMELVEGPTLAERLGRTQPLTSSPSSQGRGWPAGPGEGLRGSPLSIDEGLPIAKQIADGLEYAHERGVIHRDLKPANIKITPEGAVKILDFGLAKALDVGAGLAPPSREGTPRGAPTSEKAAQDGRAQGSPLQDSPTLTAAATQAGVILGTAAYMSPEQARGKPVDRRADIWSFGCVLYEMFTGRRIFEAETVSDTLAAVLKTEPDCDALPADTPPRIRDLLRRCLTKDPKQRLRDIGEARIAIEEAMAGGTGVSPVLGHGQDAHATGQRALPRAPAGVHVSRRRVTLAVAVLGLVVGAVLVFDLTRPVASPPAVTGVTQLTHDGLAKGDNMVTDGARIYFSERIAGHWKPVVVSAQGGDPRPIPMPFEDADVLDVSPDGSELLISVAGTIGQGAPLWALPVLGGSPRRIGELNGNEATWSPDGQEILYLRGSKNSLDLYVARSDGTGSRKLATAPGAPYDIRWSPDGKRISLSVDDTKSNTLWEVSAEGSNLHPVLPGWNFRGASCSGHWTPDGRYLLFDSYRSGPDSIWALRQKGGLFARTAHAPVRLTTGPMEMEKPLPSRDGRKIFVLGSLSRGELLRYDASSRRFAPYLGGISAGQLDFSRDGRWMAYVDYPEGTLWKSKVDGSGPLQLTFPPIRVFLPRWSPDGKRIVFGDEASSPSHSQSSKVFLVSAGGGNPEPLALGPRHAYDMGWSPDGKLLVFCYWASPDEPASIHMYNLETHQISKVPGSDGIYSPRWSPDGRFILGVTWDDLNLMLFDLQTQKWATVASRHIGWPMWSHDSEYIYFDDGTPGDWAVYRVRISDRKVERVVSLQGMQSPSGFGNYVGLARDDSVLVLTKMVGREIYALDWEAP